MNVDFMGWINAHWVGVLIAVFSYLLANASGNLRSFLESLLALGKQIGKFTDPKSDGGKKITNAEWIRLAPFGFKALWAGIKWLGNPAGIGKIVAAPVRAVLRKKRQKR